MYTSKANDPYYIIRYERVRKRYRANQEQND